jgi:uncharacterized small protein (DUF1192 family)
MTDDIVTRLREVADNRTAEYIMIEALGCIEELRDKNEILRDEIERLRKENAEWKELVNHPIWATPPRMTCTKHGIKYLAFDDFMGGVYWCEGCKDD